MKLKTAQLVFNDIGTPTSSEFDDVYFSNDNGLSESKYVFFDHNSLNQRFFSHEKNHFVIAETGFGTGLNFLLTAKLFMAFLADKKAENPLKRLYFVTTEKFPIPLPQLKMALQQWPELSDLSEQLLVQYPILTPGCHRLSFADGQIFLDLWLGDVNNTLKELHCYSEGLVDAWYLDGFAPGKNPDMWQSGLFQQMARLSRPNATFATFTAAGIVKRGLKENGFVVNKVKGFGKKRDMLAGYYAPDEAVERYAESFTENHIDTTKFTSEKLLRGPWQRTPANSGGTKVAIIGAGLAGANSALALADKGFEVCVFCAEDEPAQGASGNHLGGFYPSLNADYSLQSQFYCHGFGFAKQHYKKLLKQGFEYGQDWCGVFFPAFSEEVAKRQSKLIENDIWPEQLIRQLDSKEAETLCGMHMPYPGLYIPEGGWINPSELVNALLKNAQSKGVMMNTNHVLQSLERVDSQWRLNFKDVHCLGNLESKFDIVIFATGSGSVVTLQLSGIPFTRSRGQVDYLPEVAGSISPKTVICHKGYFTPFYQGKQAMGATFDKVNLTDEVSKTDSDKNRGTIEKALSECNWLAELPKAIESRAAIRCSLPDHRPIVGAVPDLVSQKDQYSELYKARPLSDYPLPDNQDGLFVITGLGSHGLCSSPILAEALACQISGEPLPLGNELLASLSPNRFLIRDLIRGKV